MSDIEAVPLTSARHLRLIVESHRGRAVTRLCCRPEWAHSSYLGGSPARSISHGLNSQSPEMHPSPRLSLNAGVMGFHGAGQGIHPDLNNTGIVGRISTQRGHVKKKNNFG